MFKQCVCLCGARKTIDNFLKKFVSCIRWFNGFPVQKMQRASSTRFPFNFTAWMWKVDDDGVITSVKRWKAANVHCLISRYCVFELCTLTIILYDLTNASHKCSNWLYTWLGSRTKEQPTHTKHKLFVRVLKQTSDNYRTHSRHIQVQR